MVNGLKIKEFHFLSLRLARGYTSADNMGNKDTGSKVSKHEKTILFSSQLNLGKCFL